MTFRLGVSRRVILAITATLLIGLILGYLYLPQIIPRKAPAIKDLVGIIRIDGYIVSPSDLYKYASLIDQAATNDSIKAVVLLVNSGGGYANYIEQIYHDLLKLKEKKVLVASVITALSGGYYIAVAADQIYALPTSFVGNIGVIGVGPPTLIPSEVVLETGAYKATGFPVHLFPYNLSRALDNFVSAVERGRGDRLKLTQKDLRKGLIYLGREALNVGLVDKLGSLQEAIGEAAERAGLKTYKVVELRLQEDIPKVMVAYGNYTHMRLITLEELSELHPPPAIYYIYLPTQAISQGLSQAKPQGEPIECGWDVIIDVSHRNMISWWDLNVLIAELAKKDITVSFVQSWRDVEFMLDKAACLIVASPTKPYASDEVERIESFVRRGGLLLLFFDPAWEYLGQEGLSSGIIAPINSLSSRFGINFAKGYLYNEDENYGLYRNIYIRDFIESQLTRNLKTIVFFTATHIYSPDRGVAFTTNVTYSSVSERAGKYATIALIERGNGTVAAFSDITFLTEPWCYIEDNYQLILNIVSLIAEAKTRVRARPYTEETLWEVKRPDLPVGTEKIYSEWVDGEKRTVRWVRVSEREAIVERPGMVVHYYYDENNALVMWRTDNMSAVYSVPIPEEPYPLTRGKRWRHETDYILRVGDEELKGRFTIEGEVVGFEDVETEGGIKYFCAKVKYNIIDELTRGGTKMTIVYAGYSWISSEAGDVKLESTATTYIDGLRYRVETRKALLREVRKGK